MIKAIIYTSNTGFTKKYADILSKEIAIPAFDLKEVGSNINKKEEIIYMGWLMAGSIKNYKKALKKYNVKATCAVGMALPNKKQYSDIIKKYNMKEKLFYLQGGYNKSKQKGIYKVMMDSLEKVVRPKLETKQNKNKQDLEMLEMLNNGKDCVKKENLNDIINWVKRVNK